ncbi:MAG: MBOAT family O-acyltransferase [Evtepia sp.]|uniref:MBOAT family O-acyltransferase n=1 Tax=Evtepia sp. TaxID=2773933 RepID=UPI002A75B2EB|nr:MBOAT family O-acyltransferase [Evtepia sp.]MDY3014987.1 MBOAT family O-acyltransferase [Evtepia sp.]
MVFSSLPFLFLFLTVVLLVSHILPFRCRNAFLLLANLVFYAYGEPVYVLVMIGSILVNYFAGVLMDKQPTQGRRRGVLVVGIILNLAALGVFKYTGLFVDTLREIPALSFLPDVNISLPIGISFYTFQAVSYLIDVYWKDCEASHSFVNFATYISLFPQLIAGPIVRYKDVNEQLVSRRETTTMFNSGVRLFVVGLAKKVLLANQFGMLWDAMSANPAAVGTLGAWCGACAYTLQIYFDFAGYSDMARGLGRMLGFEFCINFNYPYISKSVTEFWRRWHMSLSTWFRDYVYIPLGGNRCGAVRQCFNILVVWALTGFWHGAGWNFLFWGFYYGVLLLLEKLLLGRFIRKLPALFQHLYAMVIVIVGWVFFASPDLTAALNYLQVMFSWTSGAQSAVSLALPWAGMAIIGVVASTPLGKSIWEKYQDRKWMPLAESLLCLAALLLCTASLVSDSYNPFLYFRF